MCKCYLISFNKNNHVSSQNIHVMLGWVYCSLWHWYDDDNSIIKKRIRIFLKTGSKQSPPWKIHPGPTAEHHRNNSVHEYLWTLFEIYFVHWTTARVCMAAIFRNGRDNKRLRGSCEMFRGNEYLKMLNRQKTNQKTPSPATQIRHPYTHNAQRRQGLSGVLSSDVQFSLRDVNSFCSWMSTGGYHSSQRRQRDRRVEEAVREPRPFRGGHQRLNNRQCSVSEVADYTTNEQHSPKPTAENTEKLSIQTTAAFTYVVCLNEL